MKQIESLSQDHHGSIHYTDPRRYPQKSNIIVCSFYNDLDSLKFRSEVIKFHYVDSALLSQVDQKSLVIVILNKNTLYRLED